MRIKVLTQEQKIRLYLPNWLFLNAATAFIAGEILERQRRKGRQLPPLCAGDLRRIFREVRRSKRLLHGAPLVDVRSGDGEEVQIRL